MSFRRVPLLAVLILAGSLVVLADEPATNPAVDPAAVQEPHPKWQPRVPSTQPVPDAKLEGWFNDLGASDAAVRDGALDVLLGLTRAELPGLRRVVERSRPVSPSQAGALRDIVTHVYLSGEIYNAEPRVAFFGLMIPALDFVEVPRPDGPPLLEDNGLVQRGNTGVPIDSRIPGFCAFRALRDGDVLLGVLQPVPHRMRDWNELTHTIKAFPAGTTLTLQVLRQGALLNVAVTLDAKPLENEQAWANVVLPAREAASAKYWDEHFAPLVADGSNSSARASVATD